MPRRPARGARRQTAPARPDREGIGAAERHEQPGGAPRSALDGPLPPAAPARHRGRQPPGARI